MYLALPRNRTLDLTSPKVMGIINMSTDSFWQDSQKESIDDVLYATEKMLLDGASIIDIGGESTNPMIISQPSEEEEIDRVMPAIDALRERFDCILSLDTSRPKVIRAGLNSGVDIINDVRALRCPGALDALKDTEALVCLMHMSFPFGIEENDPLLENSVQKVKEFLLERIQMCEAHGINKQRIIIDPGFGTGLFKKNSEQNFQLLKYLSTFSELGNALLIGISRKTFIRYTVERDVAESLVGSITATAYALEHGANIIRTHDVAATVDAIKIMQKIQGA